MANLEYFICFLLKKETLLNNLHIFCHNENEKFQFVYIKEGEEISLETFELQRTIQK